MSGTHKSLILTIVMCLGLWGCARGPVSTAAAERMKALEYKVAKLEDDFHAAAAARDELAQALKTADEQRTRLENEVLKLQVIVKERDELKRVCAVRTAERDNLQSQYDVFRKSIRELLGQAETALAPPASLGQPVTTVSAAAPGKS
jgi:hypothetical protein